MHLISREHGGTGKYAKSVLTYSAFHLLRQGVRSFNAGQFIGYAVCIMIDLFLLLVAALPWLMMPAIAIVFSLPFILWTWAIIRRAHGK